MFFSYLCCINSIKQLYYEEKLFSAWPYGRRGYAAYFL